MSGPVWRKSSYSMSNGDCVEVARVSGEEAVFMAKGSEGGSGAHEGKGSSDGAKGAKPDGGKHEGGGKDAKDGK